MIPPGETFPQKFTWGCTEKKKHTHTHARTDPARPTLTHDPWSTCRRNRVEKFLRWFLRPPLGTVSRASFRAVLFFNAALYCGHGLLMAAVFLGASTRPSRAAVRSLAFFFNPANMRLNGLQTPDALYPVMILFLLLALCQKERYTIIEWSVTARCQKQFRDDDDTSKAS
jgi:hypothetical protein